MAKRGDEDESELCLSGLRKLACSARRSASSCVVEGEGAAGKEGGSSAFQSTVRLLARI